MARLIFVIITILYSLDSFCFAQKQESIKNTNIKSIFDATSFLTLVKEKPEEFLIKKSLAHFINNDKSLMNLMKEIYTPELIDVKELKKINLVDEFKFYLDINIPATQSIINIENFKSMNNSFYEDILKVIK